MWFEKWGKLYLPTLKSSHQLEICANFKDPSLQNYAAETFKINQDKVDSIFIKLTPPKPSIKKIDKSGRTKSVKSMSKYHSRRGVCIAGHCKVTMADLSLKKVEDINREL